MIILLVLWFRLFLNVRNRFNAVSPTEYVSLIEELCACVCIFISLQGFNPVKKLCLFCRAWNRNVNLIAESNDILCF